jgi:hypothetical protein
VGRRNPTISVAVVAVLIAAVVLGLDGRHHTSGPALPNPASVAGVALGPTPGESVSTYLASAAQRRLELASTNARSVTAVVDLRSYLTPSAVASVLATTSGVQLSTAFATAAPPLHGEVHSIALSSVSDLGGDLTHLQSNARTVVRSYQARVALARRHPNATNKHVVSAYANLAHESRIDAAGLGARVGCVFAVVVTGTPGALQRLATESDVRVLDPAPAAQSATDLMIVPLEPQVTSTVAPLAFAGE